MMTFQLFLSFAGVLLCGALSVFVLLKDRRLFVHQVFAVGMSALALQEVFRAMGVQAVLPSEAIYWQRLRLMAAALLPGSWLLFSLSFARANYKEFLAKWKWVILAVFACPLVLATFFGDSLFLEGPVLDESPVRLLRLGWSGYVFYLFFLLSSVSILMALERTLRATTGTMRWQIKFMTLGLGGLFAVQVYTSSQTLLFSFLDIALETINSGALVVAGLLVVFSLVRAHFLSMDIYLSEGFLYNSITLLFTGIYLLVVGVLAKAVSYVGGSQGVILTGFGAFLALLGLAIILLSDQLRQRIKRFVSRNFRRPKYDYRKEWMTFTRRTISLLEVKDLCAAVASTVSEAFGVPSVTVWLFDETQEHLLMGGSTVFSEARASHLKFAEKDVSALIRAMRDHEMPVDFSEAVADWVGALKEANADYLRDAQVRYCVTLVAGQQAVGLMTLGNRPAKEPFSPEDFDLLKTVADQAAAGLLNVQLSEGLLQAKEIEAFQTLSAFFIHDLKNLASTLSLTLQNLPANFDDPTFRKDALRTISQSVEKINAMCGRLALVSKKPELKLAKADLNQLVTHTVAGLNGSLKVSLVEELRSVPGLLIDQEQIQKVVVNLLLNAKEAIGESGEIRVTTEQRDRWVVLSVADNGCGMSKEFIAGSLFHPFQTTKKRGIGIGLFQCKKIVEAHRGRIEVVSEEGKGTTFRVMLPVEGERA